MPTAYADLFAALAAPFEPHEVKTRPQGGRQLEYVTARTVANRLDDVLGPEAWEDVYFPGENSVMCTIKVTLPDGRVVSKSDAGGYAGMSDSGDDDKSGFSDAFKRAAAKLGCGRYLYRDGVPEFVREKLDEDQIRLLNHPTGAGRMNPEPPRARPSNQDHAPARQNGQPPRESSNGNGHQPAPSGGNGQGVPRSGKALFAHIRDQEQRGHEGLLKWVNGWGRLQEFPARIVDWDAEQTAIAYAEVCRKIESRERHAEGAA